MIEQTIKTCIESRIAAALPEIPPNEKGKPRSVVIAYAKREPEANVQEQDGLIVYGWIKATISAAFFTTDWIDKMPLLLNIFRDPLLLITDGMPVYVSFSESEMTEGRNIDVDVLLFEVRYPVYETPAIVPVEGVPQAGYSPQIGEGMEAHYERLGD